MGQRPPQQPRQSPAGCWPWPQGQVVAAAVPATAAGASHSRRSRCRQQQQCWSAPAPLELAGTPRSGASRHGGSRGTTPATPAFLQADGGEQHTRSSSSPPKTVVLLASGCGPLRTESRQGAASPPMAGIGVAMSSASADSRCGGCWLRPLDGAEAPAAAPPVACWLLAMAAGAGGGCCCACGCCWCQPRPPLTPPAAAAMLACLCSSRARRYSSFRSFAARWLSRHHSSHAGVPAETQGM
jgi:hypothetical protein